MAAALNLSQGDFSSTITKIPQYMNSVQQNSAKLVNNANQVIDLLPAFIGATVKDLLNQIIAGTKKLIALLAKPITEPGDPWALWRAGSAWTQGVGNKVNGQAAVLGGSQVQLNDEWTGRAAVRYDAIRADQMTAISGIKKITDPLHTALTDVGNAIITMWVGVAAAFLTALPDIVGAAIAAAGVVTLPAAAALAGTTLLKMVPIVGTFLTVATTQLTSAKSSMTKLEQLEGPDGYVQPGGQGPYHWPPIEENIADPGDWKVRTY